MTLFREQPMNTHPYYGPGNTVIDTPRHRAACPELCRRAAGQVCDHCNLIWLNHGELDHIVHAPGRDRGRALQPAPEPPEGDQKDKQDRHRASRLETALLAWLDRLF